MVVAVQGENDIIAFIEDFAHWGDPKYENRESNGLFDSLVGDPPIAGESGNMACSNRRLYSLMGESMMFDAVEQQSTRRKAKTDTDDHVFMHDGTLRKTE